MALVDADYRFIYVDVGSNGRVSDGGVFNGCTLMEALDSGSLNMPAPQPFPGDERPVNFFVVADDAFGLKEYLIKPFPQQNLSFWQRIFNYRLSRARRVVENAFGILANRFRVFLAPIRLDESKVEIMVLASCALHNFLREKIGDSYISQVVDREVGESHELVPGAWRKDPKLRQVKMPNSRNPTVFAKQLRNYIATYVNSSIGSVAWQWERAYS